MRVSELQTFVDVVGIGAEQANLIGNGFADESFRSRFESTPKTTRATTLPLRFTAPITGILSSGS